MNWKTTALGLCAILAALAGAAVMLLDGDPHTNPDWPSVVAAIAAGIGLMHAADAGSPDDKPR